MTLHIGITGRMGSGKSFVCSIFEEEFHIPVFYSDKEAKNCYQTPNVRQEVFRLFGEKAFLSDGGYNWQAIGQMAFQENDKLQRLNAIIHPLVINNYQEWQSEQTSPYTLFESAIIYEQHLDSFFDAVIYIQCPVEIIMQRVQLRNGWNQGMVEQRLQQQQFQEDCAHKAAFLIQHNSQASIAEGRKRLLPQIQHIHKQLMDISGFK